MKYAVIGSRSFADDKLKYQDYIDWICSVLDTYHDIELIISGGARGVDTIAAKYCEIVLNIPPLVFKPDYDKYHPKVAPMIRNKTIIDHCDSVIAFHDGVSKGTIDAINTAKKMGKPVHVYTYEGFL